MVADDPTIAKRAEASLADLTTQIRAEHEAVIGSFNSGFCHAVRCGELLIAAKKIAGHGGWLPWFRANQWISARTASDYMRIAAHRATIDAKSADSADLTIQSALKLLSPPKSQSRPTAATSTATPPSSPSEKRIAAALAITSTPLSSPLLWALERTIADFKKAHPDIDQETIASTVRRLLGLLVDQARVLQ